MVGRSSDISILNSTLDLKIDYHSVSATKTPVVESGLRSKEVLLDGNLQIDRKRFVLLR